MATFAVALSAASGQDLTAPAALQAWAVREWPTFWRFFLGWCDLQPGRAGVEGDTQPTVVGEGIEQTCFFPNLCLNWADRLLDLSVAGASQPALVACHGDGSREIWSRGALRDRVARLADAFTTQGLAPGDRVVAVLRNDAEAATVALAVAAVGATLSVAAPEMGLEALADRFEPLSPRWLLAHVAPRPHDAGEPLDDKVAALARRLPTLQAVVAVDGASPQGPWQEWTLEALAATGQLTRFDWPLHPFNHPLFILFSSGTTGRPKAIVHGAGGTLLEHLKEHRLHCNLRPGERMYFHTSCSWMMWQWQLAALASGVTLVLYDGPVDGAETLWALVARERVHVFGTSPAYLRLGQSCGLEPAREFDLGALRAILSTGAILQDAQFDWVARAVGPQALQSISGGTDILGCFVLGHPDLPVPRGHAQCCSLGLDVQVWREGWPLSGGEGAVSGVSAGRVTTATNATGATSGQSRVGQLVCANPFPSRPLGFFGDADGARFHAAYFAEHPGVWTHGDLIEFGPEGGVRLHGRSDGLLNIRGIKLAPAEIARALADEPEVAEVMVVEQAGEPPRVVALLVLAGTVTTTAAAPSTAMSPKTASSSAAATTSVATGSVPRIELALLARLRRTIAQRLSPAHVPDRLLLVPALPVTHNGKPSEAAARAALCGQAPVNLLSLRNPECLALIAAAARPDPALSMARKPRLEPTCESGFEPRTDVGPHPQPPGAANDAHLAQELLPRLQVLWAEVLDLPAVGPDDHFMDLGGTSLHAAMVLSRLRPLAGCSLPLASLLHAPTPRQLAALVLQAPAGVDSAVPLGHPVHPVHPLWVDLRAGQGRPLVLVHGLSGTVMECWPLVQALRGPRPLAGLQAQGLDGGPLPPARVEAIAADYVEVLRCAQPQGPYALCGFSFGGLVALEMARLLRAQGEPIEFLGLIDPYLRRGLPAWQQWWLRGRGLLARLAAMNGAGRLAWLQARADRGPVVKGGAADAQPMGPRQRAVRARLESCLARYVPRPFAGSPVLFVRAREILPGYFDPATVWRRVLRGPLQIEEVPGAHLQLVSAQAVRLASLIDAALAGTITAAPDAAAAGGLRAVRPTARYATPV